MNAYIPLLLACLLTIPAVTADGSQPVDCDTESGYFTCEVGNPAPGNGPESVKDDCPRLGFSLNTNSAPPTYTLSPRLCVPPQP